MLKSYIDYLLMIYDGVQLAHYKNAIYTGNITNHKMDGVGIVYFDNSSIILG